MIGAGFSNMLIEAPLIFLITRELGASYTASIMLTMVIPITVRLVSLPAVSYTHLTLPTNREV